MSRESYPGHRPETALARALWEIRAEARAEILAELGAAYLRRARLDPWAVTALEVRLLRRSDTPDLRSAALLIWSSRRPAAFLRAVPRFLGDAVEVRRAVAEGLATASILEGCAVDDSRTRASLDALRRDPDPEVRALADQAERLLEPAPDDD